MTQPPSGTVTFLFTDIEGSTRLAQQHRDHWEALRARHDAILHQAMQAHNGQVFEIIGDAFSVAFHTAIDALNASIDAQRALAREAWHPAPIKVRMGIHTGTAQPSGSGGYKGYSSLARTQRLMSAGHGGQVLVSMTTEQLLREGSPDEVTLRDMGEKRLKDLVLPERIYQVVIPDLPADFPPLKTLDAYRNNLPLQMTSFIGRAKEMAEVTQAVLKHRLVTLTGPGGSGKTRLALQVAADLLDKFPDGVWFVGVGPLSDPGLVAQTVLSALGAREQPGRSALQSVLDHVRERTMLLVLDNCEHLLPACAEAVQALLSDARALKIIATSREALKLDGELTWSIPAMAQPDPERLPALDQLSQYEAVQLFIERAALVQPSFAVSKENAPAIAQICFHLDGIPLAIELAAARMRALSPGQVSARLDDRFQLLTGGKRGALPQHQTLRLAIDWSYNLLSPAEQDMLQRLSIFAGGWSLEAAEALATRLDPALGDWLDLQSNLVDKSLVAHNVDTERYSMLESVQHYALKKLEAGGRLHACRSVHQLYFLEMAEYVDREAWDVEKEAASIDVLVHNLDNLRLALRGLVDEGRADESLRLAGALGGRARGDYAGVSVWEAAEWLDRAWALKDQASPAPRARAALALGVVRWKQGNLAEGRARALESLKIYRDLEQDFHIAWSLGVAAFNSEDTGEAREETEEALRIVRRLGHKLAISTLLNNLGELERAEGNYDAAENYYIDSLALAREIGARHGEATALGNLGSLARVRKDWVRARELYEQELPFWCASNDEWFLAASLSDFANLLFQEGEHMAAARLQGFADSLCKEIGAPLQTLELEAFEATAAALKDKLGDAAYQEALEKGKTLSQDQAVDIALRRR